MSTKAPDFAARLKQLREEAGLSQRALARRCDQLTNAFISLLEKGAHQPTLRTLRKLAKALGVSVGKLLGE